MELEAYGSCTLDRDGCAVCSDGAVPVRVIARAAERALVEDRLGQRAEVALDFVPDAREGEVLLVHVGVAIGRGAADPPDHPRTPPER